ncbi:Fatty acid hydroxylase vlmA [Fulvia fulva]|uniref:Fatty acid hydroxylase vlmA n=1 Tax=Passalora fulva TaxID=5499 RepID=A0A9Q8P4Z6_PASFU|nr:Fatty acid hydroxylase vlmA [Fulvia fulva]KAK4631031.1 Fatty acid hydroxylase vlmA [Fulvia fulva]KAK4632627.1 Fatty acid hydroxylase vlmA [Fulvia fulva]UJO13379.1 Fatty acid hydroxylase vlmA [Fulvia fulva]WPV11129.1 Fatty acid hydroxylase vlmA [Fulvia fulva]WPV25982.1 Fatty acid hydroxylase vlmA [Fulvia fulva]
MSTTTTTITAPAVPVTIDRRPKDSMKSTWRKDETQWGFYHKFLNLLNVFHIDDDKEVPIHAKTDKMPYLTEWSCNVWILYHAAWPIALQYAWNAATGRDMHSIAVFLLFTVAMQLNSIHEVRVLRRLGHRFGFLDGDKHERDDVPDVAVAKVFSSLQLTTTVRPALAVLLAYSASNSMSLSWWLPLELGLYAIVLDGFFYAYHRSCHELNGLWQYHRTHHLTKHPTPLLSSYADHEQEVLEIALIPLATYVVLRYGLGLPMGFHDWWVCHEYIIYAEAFGHSGLRVWSTTPGTASWFLKAFNCELMIEDHDLHHRKGWRKSHNYGKQTRLWDRIFGTCGKRIESVEGNCDMDNKFNFPLW